MAADRQDERMGGCDAKCTHLSTPRVWSLLCDSPSLGQAQLKELKLVSGLTAAILHFPNICAYRFVLVFNMDCFRVIIFCASVALLFFIGHIQYVKFSGVQQDDR